jgi:hypothetical protein
VPSPSPPPLAPPLQGAGGEPQPVARRYTMSMNQRLHERFPHQFAPFASLGAAWAEAAAAGSDFAFRGTVIRCPLRRQASSLSPTVSPSVEALPLARLVESVPPSLLFSLSLEDVGVASWAANATEAEPLARARLVETTPAGMRQFRRELMENREWRKNKLLAQLFKGAAPAPLSIHVAQVACSVRGQEPRSDQWLLLDALAHGASRDAALSEPLKATLGGQSLLPLVSAAARLEPTLRGGLSDEGTIAAASRGRHTGRAFSIVDTGGALGLPCHVNAPFFVCDALVPALGEHLVRGRARRDFHFAGLGAAVGVHVVASGGRLRGEGADDLDRLARWNRALLSTLHEEVLPALLTTLRDLIVQGQGDGRALYGYWPDLHQTPERLRPLVLASGLGDRLAVGPYFYARRPREPPAFVKLGEAFYFDGRKWGGGGGARFESFLRRLFPLFDVPCEVLEELRARNAPVKEVTPALLRRHLRAQAQTQASLAAATGAVPHGLVHEVAGTPGLALDLLRFCLGDCGPPHAQADGLGACRVRWRELAGLPLLPLEDGSVQTIAGGGTSTSSSSSSSNPCILADSEQRALLPHLKHRFVAAAAARFLLDELKLASLPDALTALGIVRFGPDILAANVQSILPPAWKGLVRVSVDWTQVAAPLSPLWLYRFWRQVPLGLAEELFAPWPLVPATGGAELVNCALASHVLRLLPDELDARLLGQLEAEQAREAAADADASSAAAAEAGTGGDDQVAGGGRRSVQSGRSSTRPASVLGGVLSPRDICLDVKEVDLLHQQVQAAIAPAAASPRPDEEVEDEEEHLPVAAAAAVPDHGDEEALLPVAAEIVHGNGSTNVSVAGVVVAAAVVTDDEEEGEEEDAEVSGVTEAAGAAAAPAPIVSDGAARLAAALTAPERERRQELLKALKKARAPVLELAFFPREAHALLTVAEPRDVTHAVIASLHTFKESVRLATGAGGGALTGEELDHLLRRLTSTSSAGGGGGQLPVALTASEMEKLKQLPFFETLGGERVPIAEGGPYLVLDDRDAGRDSFLDELLALLEASAAASQGATALPPSSSSSSASASASMGQSKVLKRKQALDDLYKDLGVAALKKSEILSRFLVPSLPTLDRALRLRVLELLRKRWASESLAADATLVGALRETPFLERPNGELASPAELLDPRSDVLREVFDDDPGVFPQGDFASPAWLAILGALGLQGRANDRVMLEAAQRLEAFASLSPLPFAVACKAAKLVRHFVGDGELSVDKALLKKLAPIRFVPVERPGLQMTGPGPDTAASGGNGGGSSSSSSNNNIGRRAAPTSTAAAMTPNRQYQLVSFAEAAPAKDRHLVWTVLPVLLPTHVPPQLAWSALGIASPPGKDKVVQHLVNLCTDTGDGMGRAADGSSAHLGGGGSGGGGCVLDRWVFAEPPVAVFQSLFQYLQEHWVALSPATQVALKDLPCVPVGNRLVRPSRLFFRLAQDLAPFLFEVPRAFGAYDRLLRDGLGVRAVPAVQDYARLLAELRQECGESPLNPNELEAVVKVVCLLADTAAERCVLLLAFVGSCCCVLWQGGLLALLVSVVLIGSFTGMPKLTNQYTHARARQLALQQGRQQQRRRRRGPPARPAARVAALRPRRPRRARAPRVLPVRRRLLVARPRPRPPAPGRTPAYRAGGLPGLRHPAHLPGRARGAGPGLRPGAGLGARAAARPRRPFAAGGDAHVGRVRPRAGLPVRAAGRHLGPHEPAARARRRFLFLCFFCRHHHQHHGRQRGRLRLQQHDAAGGGDDGGRAPRAARLRGPVRTRAALPLSAPRGGGGGGGHHLAAGRVDFPRRHRAPGRPPGCDAPPALRHPGLRAGHGARAGLRAGGGGRRRRRRGVGHGPHVGAAGDAPAGQRAAGAGAAAAGRAGRGAGAALAAGRAGPVAAGGGPIPRGVPPLARAHAGGDRRLAGAPRGAAAVRDGGGAAGGGRRGGGGGRGAAAAGAGGAREGAGDALHAGLLLQDHQGLGRRRDGHDNAVAVVAIGSGAPLPASPAHGRGGPVDCGAVGDDSGGGRA